MSKRSPSQKKIDFQQSEYLKPHLSYFLFFHLGNCKKMLLSSCSCFCVGVIKKKKFWTNRDSSWNLSASGICLNFCPWLVVTGLPALLCGSHLLEKASVYRDPWLGCRAQTDARAGSGGPGAQAGSPLPCFMVAGGDVAISISQSCRKGIRGSVYTGLVAVVVDR